MAHLDSGILPHPEVSSFQVAAFITFSEFPSIPKGPFFLFITPPPLHHKTWEVPSRDPSLSCWLYQGTKIPM